MRVKYVGQQQEYYKPGDTVLVNLSATTKENAIKYFGEDLYRVGDERYIICQLKENESSDI